MYTKRTQNLFLVADNTSFLYSAKKCLTRFIFYF